MVSASLSSHQRHPLKEDPLMTEPWLDWVTSERAFVVRWLVGTDELGFKIRELNCPETKRSILSSMCPVYDPLGFAAPETITVSVLKQDIWKAKLDWISLWWKTASTSVGGLGSISCHSWLSFAYHVATSHAKWVASSVNCDCIFLLMHQKLATAHQHI